MRPEEARLTVTEPGWREPKWLAKNPSFKVETDSDWGLWRASGLLATDLSKTASIFAFFDQSSQREKEENRVVLQLEERSKKTLWLSGYNMVFVFFWNETFWFPILPFADSYLYPRMILIPPTRRFHTDQHHFSITMVCKIYFYFWSRFVK